MEHMSLQEITAACGGTYYGDEAYLAREADSVSIDSRKIEKGALFIPIRGERADGHDFIGQVMERGALCTLSERPLKDAAFPYILVDSCRQALMDIARHYRMALGIRVVGITGSVGKTSTKEMIASVLSQKYRVLKTDGNFNNEIGLPLTIFRIRKEHEIAVLEMGISHFGEMHRLADIARPDLCVITNIGLCHLEHLKDRDGVLRAKTEMFDHLRAGAGILLNGDDDKLAPIRDVHGITPKFFGLSDSCDARATGIQSLSLKGTRFTLHLGDTATEVTIPVPGRHMVGNALAGALAGQSFGLSADEIRAGIESLTPVAGRNHLIETDSLLIIDDCYNANPVSMKASLDVLAAADTRKVAIMGDMFELGAGEAGLLADCGRYAAEKGIDVIICIGELSKNTARGAALAQVAPGHSDIYHFQTKEDFLKAYPQILRKGDTVLVKASHGMDFAQIVTALRTASFL